MTPNQRQKMHRSRIANPTLAVLLTLSLLWQLALALPFQDIASRTSSFSGQDIMGGAAVIFKRPQRMRDLVGGASMAIVKKSTRPVTRPAEIARVTPPTRRPREKPVGGTQPPTPVLSDADKAEAFKQQGNTYYGLGQYDKAV